MVKPEFYIEQYPRLVTVIDETITQLDALPLDYVRYERREENYILACEEEESET